MGNATDTTVHPTHMRTRSATTSRALTATLFVAAVLGFFLPFATVSCGEPVTFTGVELASYSIPAATSEERDFADEVEGVGSLVALLALGAVVVGLGLVALRWRRSGTAAVVGLIVLLWLPWIAAFELASFWIHEGYVLSVGSLTGVAALGRAASVRRRRTNGQRVWPAVLAGLALAAAVVLTMVLCTAGGDG